MMNKKVELLRAIAGNLIMLANTFEAEKVEVKNEAVEVKVENPTKAVEKVEEEKEEVSYTKEQVEEMKYSELKKVCASLDLESKGTRKDLIARLLEALNLVEEEVEEEEEPEVVDEEETEEQEETLQSKVEEATAELSVEELSDILEEVGVKPKGGRQALISKIVKAVEEGLISFDDEEDEEIEEVETETSEETEEEEVHPYFDEEKITEERAKALEELEDELATKISKKEISKKEMKDLIKGFYLENELDGDISDEDLYIEARLRLVDDEGEQVDLEEPYKIDETPACCGHFLKELDGKFVCEVCGNEYEDEDEE